jgi:hypothetical protein
MRKPHESIIIVFALEIIAALVATIFYEVLKPLFLDNPLVLPAIVAVFVIVTLVFSGIALVRIGQKKERHIFEKRSAKQADLQHGFIHSARDIFIRNAGKIPEHSRPNQRTHIVPNDQVADLQRLLELVAQNFQLAVPEGTNIFVAIRERRRNEFVTIARAGQFNPSRKGVSVGLPVTASVVKALEESFKIASDCVLITGQNDPLWTTLPSDKFKEDLSVLMGAVFSKVWQPSQQEFAYKNLDWILCVCADKPDTFNKNHSPQMKCFNDTFAILLNLFLRSDPE